MVELYFDIEFLKKLNERDDKFDPVIYDFYHNFLKVIRGVDVYVNVSSIDELQTQIETNELFNILSEINSPLLLDFKNGLADTNFENKGSICKIFFVEDSDENLLEAKSGYYFISNKSLYKKWQLFVSNRQDNELVIKSNPPSTETGIFRSWSDLRLFKHIIKQILVFDKYGLANKKDQTIKNNLLPCIEQLIIDNPFKVKELTIFSIDLADFNKKKKEYQSFWLEDDIKNTLTYLQPLNKSIENISFIKYDKTKNISGDPVHNRFILTNYFFIRLGAGFNVFKDSMSVNNVDSITFDSLLKNSARKVAIEAIKNLKQYKSRIHNTETKAIGPGKVIKSFYYSDNFKCRFLNSMKLTGEG